MADHFKGRGTVINTRNRFLGQELVTEHSEGLDEPLVDVKVKTEIRYESAGKVVNKVNSPDVGMMFSVNPYQGCEHGCSYCYARNTHTYWGYSAGLDFESKIIVKKDAPLLLEKHIMKSSYRPSPISFSGNTDCYQPLEKKFGITRKCLEVMLKFRHPVSLITKNALIERDIDILKEMAASRLVQVFISINTLDEDLRRKMEPRTAGANKRMSVVQKLAAVGIPVGVMIAPVIPGLNHHEIPSIIEKASENGACGAGYIVLRLNGDVEPLFKDWLSRNYPDRADKVISQVSQLHGGQVTDSIFHRRMKGVGNMATSVSDIYRMAKKKYMGDRNFPPFDLSLFRKGGNYRLF